MPPVAPNLFLNFSNAVLHLSIFETYNKIVILNLAYNQKNKIKLDILLKI